MKRIAWYTSLIILGGALSAFAEPAAPSVSCWFSPRGGCTAAVVDEIDSAKKEVLVQAYSFTSAPIAKALTDAKKRGVAVTVILDGGRTGENYSEADYLNDNKVTVYVDHKHAIAHNKIVLIDERVVITGSFNFTRAAEEHNAENVLIIRDLAPLVAEYRDNFQKHFEHSDRYAKERKRKP